MAIVAWRPSRWHLTPVACCSLAPQYLTKKYLKSFQLRDYLHVIASDRDRNAYEVGAALARVA